MARVRGRRGAPPPVRAASRHPRAACLREGWPGAGATVGRKRAPRVGAGSGAGAGIREAVAWTGCRHGCHAHGLARERLPGRQRPCRGAWAAGLLTLLFPGVPAATLPSTCQVTFSKPHLLLLDEPSNHLDMDAVDALVEVGASRKRRLQALPAGPRPWAALLLCPSADKLRPVHGGQPRWACLLRCAHSGHATAEQRGRRGTPRPGRPPRRGWRCSRAACSWCRTTSTSSRARWTSCGLWRTARVGIGAAMMGCRAGMCPRLRWPFQPHQLWGTPPTPAC